MVSKSACFGLYTPEERFLTPVIAKTFLYTFTSGSKVQSEQNHIILFFCWNSEEVFIHFHASSTILIYLFWFYLSIYLFILFYLFICLFIAFIYLFIYLLHLFIYLEVDSEKESR